jgi:EAL and modified HD-GYP domain-containing signal transduction protein
VLFLLGEREIKRWATLVALASMADDKPIELVIESVIRGKFCEAMAAKTGNPGEAQDLFLLGMFSMIDAIMDRPLDEVLRSVPLSSDIRDALSGKPNWYREILNIAIRYERGDWNGFADCCATLTVDEKEIPDIYLQAVAWAEDAFGQELVGGRKSVRKQT